MELLFQCPFGGFACSKRHGQHIQASSWSFFFKNFFRPMRTIKKFPVRELNPGLSGESRVSWPPRLTGMNLLSTGIEPATLGLWDPRAANCATKASCSKMYPSYFILNLEIATVVQKKFLDWFTKSAPSVGLEPTTTRLRVLRSTIWATRARCSTKTVSVIQTIPRSLVGQDTRLSPVRPGFKSRRGNFFVKLTSYCYAILLPSVISKS